MEAIMNAAQRKQKPKLLDILNRHERLGDIMRVLETIHGLKESVTFALNGKWGVGKSFVLEQLTAKLRTEENCQKYVVLHYNCWQYDFYEEPLIAILTAMIDAVEPEPKRQSEALAADALNMLKETLIRVGKHYVFSRYGLDLTKLFDAISDAAEMKAAADEQANSVMDFDPNYSLKKSIHDVREKLRDYAGDKTLVIIVDELDRCLPEYAIKVMERLHHLFFGLPNTAVILGIDKKQLTQSIRQIFGRKTETDNYLRKIIHFEITLDAGVVTDGLPIKYKAYFNLFDEDMLKVKFGENNRIFRHDFDCVEFIGNLLNGITIRRQEQLINRCMTVHKLLFGTEKKDYSFLCAELFWVVLTEEYGYTEMPLAFHHTTSDESIEHWFYVKDVDSDPHHKASSPEARKRAEFKNRFDLYLQKAKINANPPITGKKQRMHHFHYCIGIGELLIWYLSRMFDDSDETYSMYNYRPKIQERKQLIKELKNLRDKNRDALYQFRDTLQIIK